MTDAQENDADAPGWDAIDKALQTIYGDQKPLHWGTALPASQGGSDPIDGISAYLHDGPPPHWHLVTYGFSELYGKEGSAPDVSGFGFELTLRLPVESADAPPPDWALDFLQNLGRYVFESGNAFGPGHHMCLNGPIDPGRDTPIQAIFFSLDPELPPIQTPNGSLTFLQITGATLDELAAAKAWDTRKLLGLMASRFPFLVTDLGRSSAMDSPAIRAAVAEGAARDGSSTGALFVDAARWSVTQEAGGEERLRLTLGANSLRDFRALLPGRIPFGRELVIASGEGSVVLAPSERCAWAITSEGEARVELTADAALALASAAETGDGLYATPAFPELAIEVERSETAGSGEKIPKSGG